MKKIICLVLAVLLFASPVSAFTFPEPDWGALLAEKREMVNETDFELYTQGPINSAPYYGAKLEPVGGTYFGMVSENSDFVQPIGSHLTYFSMTTKQTDIYYPANKNIKESNCIVTIGYTVDSLDSVDYDVIRKSLDTLNSYKKPMFIRFANEMNVSSLGNDPEKYIQVFRKVANMIHEYPNFAVVWSPNDMGALDRPFEYFYPGNEYVDWIGVSSYQKKYFQANKNTSDKDAVYFMTGDYAWATNALKPLIKFMNKNNIKKPLMISEGGVEVWNQFGEDCSSWASPRLKNMYFNVIMKYPQVKLINYFNVDMKGGKFGYYISDKDYAKNIMTQAISSGAYIREYGKNADFVFAKANDGHTLRAQNGVVNLYTLAYIPKTPTPEVHYYLDGKWYAKKDSAPYTLGLNISVLSDGAHTVKIAANGLSKSYSFYKKGNAIRFGAQPESEIKVVLNGKKLSFDTAPVMINDRVLVPVRAIFEALSAKVSWDDQSRTATAVTGEKTIKITIDNDYFTKNGQKIPLDVPAKLISGRTLVPARAVSEALDCDVKWDGENETVIITK